MIRFKKATYELLCLTMIIIFVGINTYLMLELYIKRSNFNKSLKYTSELTEVQNTNIHVNKLFYFNQINVFYYPSYKWIFNNRIYQYSSHLLIKNFVPKQIDSIIIMAEDFRESDVLYAFRCVLKSLSSGAQISFKISKVFNFTNNIRRVQCDITVPVNFNNVDNVQIAIMNIFDFKSDSTNLTENDIVSHFYKLPYNMMNFQTPRIINVPDKKLPQIAHCVHYTYDLVAQDIDKILNWIEHQKQIGVKKIVFYNANIHKLLEDTIYKRYDKDFIEIRPYHIHYEAICDYNRINYFKLKDVVKYQAMNDQCENAYYNVFDNPSLNLKNRRRHQKITSNDCYSSLQPLYQYVSYYDFDELIYPRDKSFSTHNQALDCETSNFCKISKNYAQAWDLYEYINYLIKKSFKNSTNVSSIYFKNAFYLEPNYYSKQLMMDINEMITKNYKYFKNTTKFLNNNNNQTALRLHLKFKNKYGHYFLIYPNDFDYIKDLYETFTHMECINEIVNKDFDGAIEFSFRRFLFLATSDDLHRGKSIYNTDNVDGIFAHFTTFVRTNSERLIVDINDGILSHFRNDLYKNAKELSSSIRNLKVDIEYYLHLVSKYSSTCLQ